MINKPSSRKGRRAFQTLNSLNKRRVPGPWVIPGKFAPSGGAPVSSRPGNPVLRAARAPPGPRISPPSPTMGSAAATMAAPAAPRYSPTSSSGLWRRLLLDNEAPSPSRERRGTERTKPRSTDELAANHLSVQKTSSLCLY